MKKMRIILFLVFFSFAFFCGAKTLAAEKITLQFFWAEGCPHCSAESLFLNELQKKNPDLNIERHEVSKNKNGQKLLSELSKKLNFDANGVPVTVIGNKYILGYNESTTGKEIEKALANAEMQNTLEEVCSLEEPCEENQTALNKTIKLPLIGDIETKNFSLPLLSILIGALDGFNPCAMWTLLFLISLLLGMKDRKRMWVLGTAFIVASASVYFIFMSAWLNLLLFIGFISTVRIIIGLVALGGGVYNLKDFLTNKEGGCKVTGDDKRKAVFDKLKIIVHKKSFLIALLGIVVLAFAVNLVELICSAGLPAVYTQILTMSNLPTWQYYLYILLYIFFFMLDDLFIFFIAMATLQLTGVTTKYSRVSRLVGGILMLVIGLILIFKPEWLMFG